MKDVNGVYIINGHKLRIYITGGLYFDAVITDVDGRLMCIAKKFNVSLCKVYNTSSKVEVIK